MLDRLLLWMVRRRMSRPFFSVSLLKLVVPLWLKDQGAATTLINLLWPISLKHVASTVEGQLATKKGPEWEASGDMYRTAIQLIASTTAVDLTNVLQQPKDIRS